MFECLFIPTRSFVASNTIKKKNSSVFVFSVYLPHVENFKKNVYDVVALENRMVLVGFFGGKNALCKIF